MFSQLFVVFLLVSQTLVEGQDLITPLLDRAIDFNLINSVLATSYEDYQIAKIKFPLCVNSNVASKLADDYVPPAYFVDGVYKCVVNGYKRVCPVIKEKSITRYELVFQECTNGCVGICINDPTIIADD